MPQSTTVDIPPGQIINNWVAEQACSWASSCGVMLPDPIVKWYVYHCGGWNYQWGGPETSHVVKARAEGGRLTITVEQNAT